MLAMDKQMHTMNIEERRTVVELIEVLEDVPLDESNPEKFNRIGTSMEEKKKQDLIQFLKKSTNVFALSHECAWDWPKCDYSSSKCVPILQARPSKKESVCPERDNVIKEKVQKLVTTKFICEVY